MTTPQWQPGTLYQPGALVVPKSANIVVAQNPNNPSFEDTGTPLNHWSQTFQGAIGSPGAATLSSAQAFDGTECVFWAGAVGSRSRGSALLILENDFSAAVTPGQVINFRCAIWRNTTPSSASWCNGGPRINWYDASNAFISSSIASIGPNIGQGEPGMAGGAVAGGWAQVSGSGVAPAGAAHAKAAIALTGNLSGALIYADNYAWDYTHQGLPDGLVFVAVQAAAGTSASSEPAWPVTAGLTVVDGGVTWEAEFASRITWTATSILHSGTVEPTWPTSVGGTILDNNIIWEATDGRITDPKCPQSTIVAIAASKVFAADKDIIAFCSTTNCLDWSSANDAGYLPFGLQTYGSEACAMLGLYRSNLLAFNSMGYQMWQVDQDPANMAILDSSPVGSIFAKSGAPVDNDFVFLTAVGFRSIGVAGANSNLQAGNFGKNVDPLVKLSIKTGATPRSLFYPGTGQYWGIFGATVYVLTMNGATTDMSWSQYVFPSNIDYWTISNGVLYLRSGNLVWQLSEDALYDDIVDVNTHIAFLGTIQWPYLDFGGLGADKELEGIDLVIDGACTINIGYDQTNFALATPDYAVTGDTLPGGGMLPFPMTAPSFQFRLTFNAGQAWEWEALNVYVTDTGNS